ncbi:MAG: hypothetical protein MI974_13290 [Chitinophagales bacterium]|nr:hypothetical protein [Chitinophagales bacterium]
MTEQINSEEQSIQYNSVNINWAELRNIITDLSARGNTAFNGNPPEEFTENINEYKNTLENMKKNENATPSDKKALTDRLNRLKELEKIMENQLKQAP